MKFTKTLLVAPLAVVALSASAFAADNSDDLSYSVGYSMGKNLNTQLEENDITIDQEAMVDGMSAGIKGQKPKLSQDQMQQAMVAFQQQAMQAQQNADKGDK